MRTMVALISLLVAGTVAAARVEYLNSGIVLPATLPFSEAVSVNDTVYLSERSGRYNLPAMQERGRVQAD